MLFINLPKAKNNHYLERYIKFIKALGTSNSSYETTEKHHILPRSMGGSDDSSNIIILSIRQHYVAHLLLWKSYRNRATAKAFTMMRVSSKLNNRQYIPKSSKCYEIALKEARELYTGKNHPYWGKKRSEHSDRMLGDNNPMRIHKINMSGEANPFYGKKHTEEYKKLLSESKLGVTLEQRHGKNKAEEIKKKMSDARLGEKNFFYGKTHSDETKEHLRQKALNRDLSYNANISNKLKLRPRLRCPYCNKDANDGNAKRWHFDKCKFKDLENSLPNDNALV